MATSPDTSNYGRGFQQPGLGSAGAFQVSGFPFVTGSVGVGDKANTTYQISFPNVTKSITFFPTQNSQYIVSFADPTANSRVMGQSHTFMLPYLPTGSTNNPTQFCEPVTIDVKCSDIWVTEVLGRNNSFFTLYASLTSINPGATANLSGSGINA